MKKQQQKGFTLIELVLVIIVLGVLAATAVPKFVDLKGEAETSNIEVAQRSIDTALTIAIAKHATNNPNLNDVISYVKSQSLVDTLDTDGQFTVTIGSKVITVQSNSDCTTPGSEVAIADDTTAGIACLTYTVV